MSNERRLMPAGESLLHLVSAWLTFAKTKFRDLCPIVLTSLACEVRYSKRYCRLSFIRSCKRRLENLEKECRRVRGRTDILRTTLSLLRRNQEPHRRCGFHDMLKHFAIPK